MRNGIRNDVRNGVGNDVRMAALPALLALAAAGCFKVEPKGGLYSCAQGCPSDYSCSPIDQRCWPTGTGPQTMTDHDMSGPMATPSSSTSSASGQPSSAVANGSSQVTITVTVRDTGGSPIANAQVFLSSTGTGNTIMQPDPTDDKGSTSGRISSTVGEVKTITAALGGAGSTIVVTTHVEFTVPMPVNLLFSTQPGNTAPHAILSPAVLVKAVDADNLPFNGPSVSITISLVDTATPTGATLSGSVTVNTTNGIAKFDTLSIDKAGAGFKLTAKANGLIATSAPFTVSDSLPSPPTNVTAVNSNASTITVSWTSPDVDHFTVSRGTTAGGPYTSIATPTGTTKSIVDKNLLKGTYYYIVTASTSVGDSGGSGEASGESHQELCVANATANNGDGSVTVISGDSRDSALGSVRSFTTGLSAPYGLATLNGTAGQIFVVNNGNNTVAIYPRTEDALTNDTAPVILSGPTGSTGLNTPTSIAYDATHDEIIIANTGNNSVMGFVRTASGAMAPKWTIVGAATGLSVPEGIAVDGVNGYIYVGNFGNNKILTFQRSVCLTQANCAPYRTWTNSGGSIAGPAGLYFDGGTLFVANTNANNVASFDNAFNVAAGTSALAATRIVAATNFSAVNGVVANATLLFVANGYSVIALPRAASGTTVTGTSISAGGVLNGATGIAFCN
jgi:Big-like domain-containing protein/fibronectin type III domain protein